MSFNNATTIRAEDIEGDFGDNVTITGSVIQTAASGRRIEIGSNPDHLGVDGEIRFYSGEADELSPGDIQVGDSSSFTITGSADTTYPNPPFLDMAFGTAYLVAEGGVVLRPSSGASIVDDVIVTAGAPQLFLRSQFDFHTFAPADYANSWVSYSAGGVPDAGYYIDPLGFVTLRGWVKNGVVLNGTVATLPAGFRPYPVSGKVHSQVAISNGGIARITVSNNGAISFSSGGNATWSALDGVRFPVFG